MSLITCTDASFAYEGNTVVSGLNFSVDMGDYLYIVGENGSGKTTLIHGLLRLKHPNHGKVLFDDGLRSNQIGYMPQQTAAQKDFPASAYEIVLSGRLGSRGILPFYSKEDKEAADRNINCLGISDLRNKCYRELSGGQQRKVLLARALCATGRILLLDEPVAGLDPVATQDMYNIIEKINRETGIAVVMVSHDINSAVKYAGHILHLKNEQIFYGTPDDYVKSGAGTGFIGGGNDN